MVRFLVSLLLGAAVTFGLFVFMAYLIGGGAKRNEAPPPTPVIDIVTSPPESDVQQRRRTPPPPPPPPSRPPQTPDSTPDTSDAGGLNMDLGFDVNVGGADTGLAGPGSFMNQDGDATPIVRIEPRYPQEAARGGIEGWVQLSFTIDEAGNVTDVEILDSQPRRVFDREARRALLRWKYKPKVIDGKPVRQEGMTVQLDFNLQEN
ncbi:energy transducer TonB [Idiomarina tyrosinivorans]|uniref:Protein TonB n=1 Tax=Idiomarina tyrosinivorans TaxID=1445662 RepID=A0A432ZLA8_9GAMM|nr:energy transducer TonB [Idiomarina tyrosinivorans]RUO78771.1 energy transducer TonB [Idiomarina tyrosinivorans]